MKSQKILMLAVAGLSAASLGLVSCGGQQYTVKDANTPPETIQTQAPANTTKTQQVRTDVPPSTTPQPVVEAMLNLAKVNKNDVIYDLGSGDGRIVITAAQKYGTKGTGIDTDPQRLKEAKQNAQKAGVTDRVKFVQQDLFKANFSNASVVMLYLLPDINIKLRPQLLSQLKPGTRIVSHDFDMGDWKPQQVRQVNGSTIYLWVVPENPPANLLSS